MICPDCGGEEAMKVQTYILGLLVFLLITVFDFRLYSQFTLPKMMMLFGSVSVLFFLFVRGRPVKVITSTISISSFLLALWFMLSAIFALHVPMALKGDYNVFQGYWVHITYLLLFWITALITIKKERLVASLLISAVIVSLYAIVQYLGYDFLYWTYNHAPTLALRPSSSIGNPVILGAVLLLALPFALYNFLGKRFIIGGITAAILSFVIGATLSRGVLLGSIAVIAIMLFATKGNRKLLISGIVIITLLISSAIIFSHSDKSRYTASRYQSVDSDFGVNTRLQYWKMALSMIKDNPVFGVGIGNFNSAYPLYRTEAIDKAERDTMNSKAHNGYLHLAATSGIPALIAYLALIGFVIQGLWRKHDLLAMTFLASIAGYLVQDLTGWQEMSLTPLFWIILGLAVNYSNEKN